MTAVKTWGHDNIWLIIKFKKFCLWVEILKLIRAQGRVRGSNGTEASFLMDAHTSYRPGNNAPVQFPVSMAECHSPDLAYSQMAIMYKYLYKVKWLSKFHRRG